MVRAAGPVPARCGRSDRRVVGWSFGQEKDRRRGRLGWAIWMFHVKHLSVPPRFCIARFWFARLPRPSTMRLRCFT